MSHRSTLRRESWERLLRWKSPAEAFNMGLTRGLLWMGLGMMIVMIGTFYIGVVIGASQWAEKYAISEFALKACSKALHP